MGERVWIDTQTGTWGRLDNLVLVNEDELPFDLLSWLDNASDSEIIEFGENEGRRIA